MRLWSRSTPPASIGVPGRRPRLLTSIAVAASFLLAALFPVLLSSDAGSAPPGATASAPPLPAVGALTASNVGPATAGLLTRQLAAARRVAMRYPTLATALRAGYTQAAPYAPGIGSHYMKYSLIYRDFNPAAPAMLLFDGDVPASKLVGLAYYVYDSQGPPAGFAGAFDHWHQHRQTCVSPSGAHFEGDDSAIACRGRGRNAWMLHLWVTPGYQTVNLIFSDFCNILE